MDKKINKLLDEISKLGNLEIKKLSRLNSYQMMIIKFLKNHGATKVSDLINIKSEFSRAQKYRLILKLINDNFCILENNKTLKLS